MTPSERFWSKVDKSGECWLWTGRLYPNGYGHHGGRRSALGDRLAHRLAYELAVGSIPNGLVLDHLCAVKRCVNPEHLEPVTQQENLVRAMGGLCRSGHPMTEDNVYTRPDGKGRMCRTCRNQRSVESRARRRTRRDMETCAVA